MFTSLKNCPGKLSNTTFDPFTGLDVNLFTATNDPSWKKSATPLEFCASILAVAVINPLPLATNVGLPLAYNYFLR